MTTLRMISGITYTRKNLEALTGMPDQREPPDDTGAEAAGCAYRCHERRRLQAGETGGRKAKPYFPCTARRALDEAWGTYQPPLPELCRWTGQMEMGGGNGTV